MASALNVPLSKIHQVSQDLLDMGLLEESDQKLKVKSLQLHLESNASMISKHHLNWRLKAMESIERGDPHDLHYSSVVSLSAESVTLLKEKFIEAIKEVRKVVTTSPDEELWCYSFDAFNLKNDH
jgi:predicted transcriptional regulator